MWHLWKLKFSSYTEQSICQNVNLKVFTKLGICENLEDETYRKEGLCKGFQALSLYEVGCLWKLKFNSYKN